MSGRVHWLVYNVLPTTRSLQPEMPEPAMIEGINSRGARGYEPICPRSGRHFYRFKVYALDVPLPAFAMPTDDRIVAAMAGHILATGELTAMVKR
jgi:Raf kinase inhibitor-like YbhB/YbcL family protein